MSCRIEQTTAVPSVTGSGIDQPAEGNWQYVEIAQCNIRNNNPIGVSNRGDSEKDYEIEHAGDPVFFCPEIPLVIASLANTLHKRHARL